MRPSLALPSSHTALFDFAMTAASSVAVISCRYVLSFMRFGRKVRGNLILPQFWHSHAKTGRTPSPAANSATTTAASLALLPVFFIPLVSL